MAIVHSLPDDILRIQNKGIYAEDTWKAEFMHKTCDVSVSHFPYSFNQNLEATHLHSIVVRAWSRKKKLMFAGWDSRFDGDVIDQHTPQNWNTMMMGDDQTR